MERKKLYKAKKNWVIGLATGLAIMAMGANIAHADDNVNFNTSNESSTNTNSDTIYENEISEDQNGLVQAKKQLNGIKSPDYSYITNVNYDPMVSTLEHKETIKDVIKNKQVSEDDTPLLTGNYYYNNNTYHWQVNSSQYEDGDAPLTESIKVNGQIYDIRSFANKPNDEDAAYNVDNKDGINLISENGNLTFSQQHKDLQIRYVDGYYADSTIFDLDRPSTDTLFRKTEKDGIITNTLRYKNLSKTEYEKDDVPDYNYHTFRWEFLANNSSVSDDGRTLYRVGNTNIFYSIVNNIVSDQLLVHFIKPVYGKYELKKEGGL